MDLAEVQTRISSLKNDMIGYKYKHFKGNYYVVKDLVIDSESNAPFVVYSSWNNLELVWSRPLDMFLEEVDHTKYPEVNQVMRFERMEKVLPEVSLTQKEIVNEFAKQITDKVTTKYCRGDLTCQYVGLQVCDWVKEIADSLKQKIK